MTASPLLHNEAIELIRSLIDQVMLLPLDGRLEISLRGELAGILALCETARKTKPGTVSGAGLAEQLVLVTGTRCEYGSRFDAN